MDIVFTRSRDRRDVTFVTRRDGVRLSVPVFGKLDPIPHDLAHYVVERELELRDGFWGSVADGAIFTGMHVLEGRQPPHARERSQALQKTNGRGILFAEVVVDATLRAHKGEPLGNAALPVEYLGMRTRAERDELLAGLRFPIEEMCDRWAALAEGDTLLVDWPEARAHSRRRAAHHAGR